MQRHLAFLSISYRTVVLRKAVQYELRSIFLVYDRQSFGFQLRINWSDQVIVEKLYQNIRVEHVTGIMKYIGLIKRMIHVLYDCVCEVIHKYPAIC